MKVQVWSDIMCPFCYLGDQNLKSAIQAYKGSEPIEVEFMAFQLNPTQEKSIAPDNPINYTIKKGLPEERIRQSFKYIENEAKNLGLPMNIEKAKVVNSLDCLRLLKYAQKNEKYEEIKDDLFKAYFAEGKDLSDRDFLLTLAGKNKLNVAEVSSFLNSKEMIAEVNQDRNVGISKGLQGVPFFVIDNSYVLSGNQSKENFLNVFEKINQSSISGESCDIATGMCE